MFCNFIVFPVLFTVWSIKILLCAGRSIRQLKFTLPISYPECSRHVPHYATKFTWLCVAISLARPLLIHSDQTIFESGIRDSALAAVKSSGSRLVILLIQFLSFMFQCLYLYFCHEQKQCEKWLLIFS